MHPYSVVIAVKNGEKYIQEAIDSIFEQTFKPASIFVVDDASSDRTVNILKKSESKLEILKNNETPGQVGALLSGLKLVRTPLVSFLDADDYWHKSKQEVQTELFKDSSINVVSSGIIEFFSTDENFNIQKRMLSLTRLFAASTFKTSLFNLVPLSTSFKATTWQFEWWERATNLGIKSTQINFPHMYRRIHSGNMWKAKNLSRDHDLIEYFRNKLSLESQSNDFK